MCVVKLQNMLLNRMSVVCNSRKYSVKHVLRDHWDCAIYSETDNKDHYLDKCIKVLNF